jgi:hypothetical protein
LDAASCAADATASTSPGSSSTAGSWIRTATGCVSRSTIVTERPDPGSGDGERAALCVDEHRLVGQPVADVEGRVAESPGQLAPQRAGTGLAQLDDEVGDGGPLPRGNQQSRQQPHRKRAKRQLVHAK